MEIDPGKCTVCGEKVGAGYVETHMRRRHSAERQTEAFASARPSPHFTGLVNEWGQSRDRMVMCPVCGWRMDRKKLAGHRAYRHSKGRP